ncbi:universal stress protein [Mycolicibacterium wolinskyi]|uniref:Universal stress protein n=1 Tax=Mycolicibacterium wolinskyi TaxID=59750 RepID=A0A132PJJ3_9MYCO|nr:universal stress protein [Mycolicibacterium wolinskyi]KWX22519.1 universal stress protein [Mycolicibacterium wolinskyi]
MSEKPTRAAVVAGVDGSEAAVKAAQWAADEALGRGVPLRLVYVTKPRHPSAEDYYADVHRGEAALQAAKAELESTGSALMIQTATVDGPAGRALIEESRTAAMICVGSVGIGRYAQSILGSTATELAEKSVCPTAIIRADDYGTPADTQWIVFAMTDPQDDAVVESAMSEARLRHAPVLALGDLRASSVFDGQIEALKQTYPDVHLYPITNEADVTHFLKKHDEAVQLAIVGSSDTAQIPRILGPFGRHRFHLFHHAASSVLVARRSATG